MALGQLVDGGHEGGRGLGLAPGLDERGDHVLDGGGSGHVERRSQHGVLRLRRGGHAPIAKEDQEGGRSAGGRDDEQDDIKRAHEKMRLHSVLSAGAQPELTPVDSRVPGAYTA